MATSLDFLHERALNSLQADLEALRESISRELGSIPAPIPACDVNFNRLLDERAGVVDALQMLRRLRGGHCASEILPAIRQAVSGLDVETRLRVSALLDTLRDGAAC